MTRRVQATQLRAWTQQGGDPMFIGEIEDGARNTIKAWATLDGTVGFLHMELLQAVTGALLDDIEIIPAAGMKLNRCSIWLRDNKVSVRFINHQPGEGQPEGLSEDQYYWESPHIVPVPFGQSPMGRDGEIPIPAAPGSDPVDYARIAHDVDAAEQDDYARIIANIKPKDVAAIEEAFTSSFQVWSQETNTAYTGCLAAIRDAGLAAKFTPAALAALAALDAANAQAKAKG